MDEKEWLQRLKRRDMKALEEGIRFFSPYVLAVISNILRKSMTREDIEEVAADVFLELWNHAESIRSEGSVKGYLSRTARNKAINKLRKNHLTLELEEDILSFSENTPEEICSEKEKRAALQAALSEMPSPDREIFLRHYYYGQSVSAIAGQMNLNPSTVKSKLRRGREKLKQKLSKGGLFDETAY